MKKNNAFVLMLLFFTAVYLVPAFTFANGGDQRIVEGKYYINLSRAPFTPRVGVKTSFLASFVDIQKNKLVSEDLVVRIRISKLGDAPKGNFIFEQNNIALIEASRGAQARAGAPRRLGFHRVMGVSAERRLCEELAESLARQLFISITYLQPQLPLTQLDRS